MLKHVPAKCPRPLSWLVRMQTAVKEGTNVETGTRKVSVTTELVWHSDAGPGARAARPHTHCAFLRASLHVAFEKNSNSARFLQARDSNRLSQDGSQYLKIWTPS